MQIAKDGETALSLFKANKYHLIFMDISLPSMDGIETTKKIRKLEQETGVQPVPIIALSVADDVPCFKTQLQIKGIMRILARENATTIANFEKGML